MRTGVCTPGSSGSDYLRPRNLCATYDGLWEPVCIISIVAITVSIYEIEHFIEMPRSSTKIGEGVVGKGEFEME